MPSFSIGSYLVKMFSSRPTTNLSPSTAVACIYFYDQQNAFLGVAYFHPDGTLLPEATDNGHVVVRFNLSQFPATLHLLQSEKPVHLFSFGYNVAGLGTGLEPIGEEETGIQP